MSALGLVLALIGLAGLARGVQAPLADAAPDSIVRAHLGPVDVNAASVEELATLPGIGPTLASRIVDDRSTRGRFPTLDALDRVPGVGPSTIAELRPHAIAGAQSQ